MVYVIDTSVISTLHRNFYRSRFPSLWKRFDAMADGGQFTSTREAHRELLDGHAQCHAWVSKYEHLFPTPDAAEAKFVVAIYAVKHFQGNIETQKILKGGKNADPFLVARAHCCGGTVLTMEQFKPNAARIPNICAHFEIPCVHLERFMEIEGWTF
jgi:Domain of unknown function (DUF4411)